MTLPKISYDPGELDVLARLEERHFWFQARRRLIVAALGRWFGNAESYLEVGCGTGYNARGIAAAFPRWRVVASDPLARDGGWIQRIDILDLPVRDAFDVVGAYDVLEHIDNDSAALRQLHRACRPGGGILLTVPQHPRLWSPADTHAGHYRRYTSKRLLSSLEEAGFSILGWSSFLTLCFPLFFLRAALSRVTGRPPGPKIPLAPLNWALARSIDLDGYLIAKGNRLPFGASLLVAARRVES